MQLETAFLLLFTVATAVAMVIRWLKMPYTVALVVAGLFLGQSHAIHPPHLTKDLLYGVILPGLLFEAAYHLEFRNYWTNKVAIHALAIPGVVAAIAATALILRPVAEALHFVDRFGWADALVFAALISATDPIAVVGLFKSLGAPKRLAVLVEGESLLNDGTAVVLFTLVLAYVGGTNLTVAGAALEFIRVVGMGLLVGLAVGFAVSRAIHMVDDPMIEITLTSLAAYGSFVLAEQFHFSGVIATVTAGMLCGNYAARTGMSPSTRVAVETFWEYAAFALNSVVFLLIGFEVDVDMLLSAWQPIVAAYLAVTVARGLVVGAVSLTLLRTRERIPASWTAVMTWGGLRGGLSMVLVLGLPDDFEHRSLLVTITFGVVLLSIMLQGLSMSWLLRKLGLAGADDHSALYERQRTTARAVQAALAALERMQQDKLVHQDTAERLRGEYRQRLEVAERAIKELPRTEVMEEEERQAHRALLMVEKEQVMAAHRQGLVGPVALEELLRDVDARLVRVELEEPAMEGPHGAQAQGGGVATGGPGSAAG